MFLRCVCIETIDVDIQQQQQHQEHDTRGECSG